MSREELLKAQEEESRQQTERRFLDETQLGQSIQSAGRALDRFIGSAHQARERLAQGARGRLQTLTSSDGTDLG